MMLVYLIFALTLSSILTALFSTRVQQSREGELFIGFFVAIMALAWAADEWLLPALAAGWKTSWPPVMTLVIFGAVFVASLLLSVRTTHPLGQAVIGHGNNRLGAEAAAFDLVLWLAFLLVGIVVMRSIGI